MTAMVHAAVASDVREAEEMQEILRAAGIDSEVEAAEDDSLVVLVPESDLEAAQDAIEAGTEPDEIVAEP
jgi:type III secretory pathway lipoprotein EscJ